MGAIFRFTYFASYLGFRFFEGLVRLLPLELAFSLGRLGGALSYHLLRKRRHLALGNLRLAFGTDMSEAQLRALNREHFQLLGANLLAGFRASRMSDDEVWKRVEANIPAERLPPGWVALISHIGNWELFSHLSGRYPEYRYGAIFQGLSNPYIDRYLGETRAGSGNILFDRRTELLKCVRFLKEGGVVGVLIDQGAGYAGLWTPLFNRLTSSSTLAATLAIRTGHPVVPIAINTAGHARWKMTISEPVYPPEDGDTEVFTARINRLLEEQIRRHPADWLWAHNRWKPLRPHLLFARDQRRVFFPPEFDRTKLDPFRILIVSPDEPEHAAATHAAVAAIKNGRPDVWLGVLVPQAVAQLWENMPEVDASIVWPSDASPFEMAAQIKDHARFDAAIFFEPRLRSALAVFLAGIPIRVGRRYGLLSMLYNQRPVPASENSDATGAALKIAHSIGANLPARFHLAPPPAA
ncbi:MAG: hypothetical protein ABIR71_11975 [Chthoniobacterales bacterium]